MEVLNRPLPNAPLTSSRIPFFIPQHSTKTLNIKKTQKFHKSSSLSFYLRLYAARNVQVSVHFGGPTSRRNSLRKKLIDDQDLRRRNLISLAPISDFENSKLDGNMNHSRDNFDSSNALGADNGLVELESVRGWDSESTKLSGSGLLTKLENWIDQYKKDGAYWGIGSSPIFTVFLGVDGNVKRVAVDESEILKRSLEKKQVDSKIAHARGLAREMERGGDVIPRNSSVAKFVAYGEESGIVGTNHGVVLQPEFGPVVSKIGRVVLCGFIAIWAVKKLLGFGNKEERCTELEKEMLRRKMKSRKEKEMLEGRVEVVQEPLELPVESNERPKLDRKELMKNIFEAKCSKDKLLLVDSSSSKTTNTVDLEGEMQTIKAMARQVREIESRKQLLLNKDGEEKQLVSEDSSSEMQVVEEHAEEFTSFLRRVADETTVEKSLSKAKSNDNGLKVCAQASCSSSIGVSEDGQTMVKGQVIQVSDIPDGESWLSENRSTRVKPRLILSVKEAREFLSKKGDNNVKDPQFNMVQESSSVLSLHGDKIASEKTSQKEDGDEKVNGPFTLGRISDPLIAAYSCEDSSPKVMEPVPTKSDDSIDLEKGCGAHGVLNPQTFLHSDLDGNNNGRRQSTKMENWLEKNFDEVEPIVKKIGDGFRDNYKIAREKIFQATNMGPDITQLVSKESDEELAWMKDDGLKEIVFQVRENELSGRDPFVMMDAEDKHKFFKGLEKKVEEWNEKLIQVHEYLHSNIENLDYGADGISLHDLPEKFIPRWKGPPLEKNPEFLSNFLEQRNANFSRNALKKDKQTLPQKSTESTGNEHLATSSVDYALEKNSHGKVPKDFKTVIEGSDGSVRAGKKSGKEYWQHTKKWSRGFLESYNAETDPDVKSTMKDIGNDLDRWITEEEVQEAADLMTKLSERNKKFMEKKINKLKREMELFGPQAVVSKYREYAEDKEEDYLWWLDLPHILCIELYTTENGEQRMGFYSLEMAADLELEPQPCHVIAFEDVGDCKNLCYIIQAHMDMLGNGHAFVVPRPPKDAFREARANGFSVTVIRKGELLLNVDQTLEEVEEQLIEIGSKMYHDKLMREHSVDISSLTKGIFGVSDQKTGTKGRRSKSTLQKPWKKSI